LIKVNGRKKRKSNTINQCIDKWPVNVRKFFINPFIRCIFGEATIVKSTSLIELLGEVFT